MKNREVKIPVDSGVPGSTENTGLIIWAWRSLIWVKPPLRLVASHFPGNPNRRSFAIGRRKDTDQHEQTIAQKNPRGQSHEACLQAVPFFLRA